MDILAHDSISSESWQRGNGYPYTQHHVLLFSLFTGFHGVDALVFSPFTGVLFGADDHSDSLITIDLSTGAGSLVGHPWWL